MSKEVFNMLELEWREKSMSVIRYLLQSKNRQ